MKQYAVSKNKWPFKKTIGDAHLVALIFCCYSNLWSVSILTYRLQNQWGCSTAACGFWNSHQKTTTILRVHLVIST